jgi:hypothetical protein
MARLTPEQWKAIQTHFEYDLDEPSIDIAAARAEKEHNFKAPARSNIYTKQKKEGWQRKGNLNGINQAAQRRADKLVDANGKDVKQDKQDKTGQKAGVKQDIIPVVNSAAQEAKDRDQSLAVRSEVTVRHRKEWGHIGILRNEAYTYRDKKNYPDRYDLATYYGLLKSAKLAAEITAIQQAGERKAWGMDVLVDPGMVKNLSDEALEAIASGKNT